MKVKSKIVIILSVFAIAFALILSISASQTKAYGSEVTLTTVRDGKSTVSSGKFDTLMSAINNLTVEQTANAEFYLILNSDVSTSKFWELRKMSKTAKLSIDLNGYTLTATQGNVIQMRSSYVLNIDGADEKGNRGKWVSLGSAASPFYIRAQGDPTSDATANITNLDIVVKNLSNALQPALHIQNGTTNMTGVKIIYTGENLPLDADTSARNLIKLIHGTLRLVDCEIRDENTRGIKVYAIDAGSYIESGVGYHGSLYVENTKVSTYYGIKSSYPVNKIEKCNIEVKDVAYTGAGNFDIIDTATATEKNNISSTTCKLIFAYGDGISTIKIKEGNMLEDKIITEDGYVFVPKGDGSFYLDNEDYYSTVTMPNIFSDGMVFQRDMPIKIFGYCRTDGASIKVSLGAETKIATVNDGEWEVCFDPIGASSSLTLTVEQLDVNISQPMAYTDIAIGEVWVISGQSNAEYELYKMEDAEDYINNADNFDNIRIFASPRKYSFETEKYGFGSWHKVTAELLLQESEISGGVPAIAYVAATKMASVFEGDVTVAIIDAAYAGSGIYPWIDFDSFKEKFDGRNSSVSKSVDTYEAYEAFINKNGRLPYSSEELSLYIDKPYRDVPSVCYNAMIEPIFGYSARGVIWYQGETNIGLKDEYIDYFDALKETYKKAFSNEDLKFFAVQLAPYGTVTDSFRAAQYKMSFAKDTYLISSATEGVVFNSSDLKYSSVSDNFVHPSRKSPIGLRIADAILKNVYGFYESEVVTAPEVIRIERNGSSIVIAFDSELEIFFGEAPSGFEIAGIDGKYHTASAVIDESRVILSASGVSSPAFVRYGFGKMNIVLADGTMITYDRSLANSSDTEKAKIIAPGGKAYEFHKDSNSVICTRFNGNLTNASGAPMPTFELAVGYEKEN